MFTPHEYTMQLVGTDLVEFTLFFLVVSYVMSYTLVPGDNFLYNITFRLEQLASREYPQQNVHFAP